ncbi:MAG: HAMP domain-containing protein [Proteobacteria bacterium]|nr:HAMP domain-containing protein [Pseudomonadota bacterium]MBU1685888.1 HAMP domain-containing protein [Pseudomonadota bacterium]
MSRLFIKIFLWFWLATTLIGALLVTLALTTNHRQAFIDRQKERLTEHGMQLILIYEDQGAKGLSEAVSRYLQEEKIRLALVNVKTQSLGRKPLEPRLREYARQEMIDKLMWPMFRGVSPQSDKELNSFAIPLIDDYVLLAEMPKPTMLELFLDPQALALRLGITFLIAGIICYLLARSITAPIMRLRTATQEFAAGRLSTRVTPLLGGTGGELADLAHDFDSMAEQIENLLHSQQRLLRDISHELRSPLARLNIALELARLDPVGNQGALDRIELESDRLNELIGQLLTITRLEEQSDIRESSPVELNGLLQRVVDDANYESQVKGRSLRLTCSAPGLLVMGSAELLHRAVENVVRNGLLYSPEHSTVDIDLTETPEGRATITVRDYGKGVPEEALAELFRPFYRVGESRDRKSGGTGVGLAIAERAIHLHGGTITAANATLSGLKITMTLPLIPRTT